MLLLSAQVAKEIGKWLAPFLGSSHNSANSCRKSVQPSVHLGWHCTQAPQVVSQTLRLALKPSWLALMAQSAWAPRPLWLVLRFLNGLQKLIADP